MADITPIQTSFNGGELSPNLKDRVDQNVRGIGLQTMLGYFPKLSGAAEAMPGTIMVEKCKGPSRAIPYAFNVTQSYIIEAGDGYMRFYTNDVRIETSPGVPYEIATPWSYGQTSALWYEQSLDVLYLSMRDVPLHRLYRASADTFVLEPWTLRNGPFETRNSVETLTVTASATTGTGVTITATSPIFAAGDVGGLMEIEGGDFSSIPSWEAGISSSAGALCQWNGRVYENVGGTGRTGTVPPIHIEGTEYDGSGVGTDINGKGPYGVQWAYRYDRFGLIEFTGFTSATVMTAKVIRRLPTTAPCWRWRFGAFSPRRGHPELVALWQDRLALAKDATVYASVSEGLDDFAYRNELGDISRDMAFTKPLGNANAASWIVGDAAPLLVGTAKAEHLLTAASAGQGAGPGNVDTDSPEDEGSARIRPIKIGGRIIYVQRAREKLMQIAYDANRMLRQESADLCRYSDHIGAAGFTGIAWQKAPERLIWATLNDGTMAAAAYVPDELMLGWSRRALGGGLMARSVASITDPDGRFDQIWITAETADGAWWMLRMAPLRRPNDAALDKVMSDAAIIYRGAATTAVSAPHLAGRTVEIVADGKVHPMVALDGAGAGHLDYAASTIITGLPFPAEIISMPLEGGAENGTAQNKMRQVHRVDVGCLLSDGIEVEVAGRTIKVEQQAGDSPMDTAFPLYSGFVTVEPGGIAARDCVVKIRRYLPKPSTITSFIPYASVGRA